MSYSDQENQWRDLKQSTRNSLRDAKGFLRLIYNQVQAHQAKLAEQERKLSEEEKMKFREEQKKPGEKEYSFMIQKGGKLVSDPINDVLAENLDLLKNYLDSYELQYCFREHPLDGTMELIYFAQDKDLVIKAFEKAQAEILNQEERADKVKETTKRSNVDQTQNKDYEPKQLGYTPRRENPIYESYEKQERLEHFHAPDIGGQKWTVGGEMILNEAFSPYKFKAFLAEFDIPISVTEEAGRTSIHFLCKEKDLPMYETRIRAAFEELSKHPDKIRKAAPTMKEMIAQSKHKQAENIKALSQAKDITKELPSPFKGGPGL